MHVKGEEHPGLVRVQAGEDVQTVVAQAVSDRIIRDIAWTEVAW